LLDCFAIPVVMFFSWLVFRVRFRLAHVAGVLCCLIGLALLVASDLLTDRNTDANLQAPDKRTFVHCSSLCTSCTGMCVWPLTLEFPSLISHR
jgi:drug/metabolite transporter (DMT)-like permease